MAEQFTAFYYKTFDENRANLTALYVDEEQRPQNYTQVFQLMPDGAGSYFVFNDVFRLIYSSH
ncbi:MAG: hypothetical protein Q9217_004120 [Psora testacea]